MTVDQLLDEHVPKIALIANTLRMLIRTSLPDAEERVYPGWHGLGYHLPTSGYLCGIFPKEDRVKLGFEHGASLSDPKGILQGKGKQVRYLVVTDWREELRGDIQDLIDDALHMP